MALVMDRPARTLHVGPALHDGATVPTLACPNCLRRLPAVAWRPLHRPPAYIDQLAPVYRCGHCRYVFAPLPPA